MSYDVSIYVDDVEVFWSNYTSNVAAMWRAGLGRSIADYDQAPCVEAAGPLAAGARRMEALRADLLPLEPENGWGTYAGALTFLQSIATEAAKHPTGTLSVIH